MPRRIARHWPIAIPPALIVSHNRDFLDTLVTKTIEFRPGEEPRLFHGNIAYYLDKQGNVDVPSASSLVNLRLEAVAREARAKILTPLEKELETLEEKIAEQEAAQATLTVALSNDDISGDAEKLCSTTTAVEKVTKTLDLAYTRWSSITKSIEQVKAMHGL